MSHLKNLMRRFLREDKGSLVVEAVIIMPMFVWAYAGLFVYWDAYRSVNSVQKASYTISDLISRSQNSVNDTYLAGMATTFNTIVGSGTAGSLRVTSYTWSALRNRYEVIFSRSPNNAMTSLTTANLATLTEHLPIMSDGDSAILIETSVPYDPPMSYGLEPATIDEFIVTRPRFLPKLCHTSFSC
jgi:Flp pilus assembly protein TadG